MNRFVYSGILAFTLTCLRRRAGMIVAAVLLFPTVVRSQNPEWIVYKTDNSGLPDDDVRALAIDAQGNKWIGTAYGGLAKFDGTNWTVYNPDNSGLRSRNVSAIAIDEQGNMWIVGLDGGLVKFDGVNWTIYTSFNSRLPDNDIVALAIDAEGNKWIAMERFWDGRTYTSLGLAKFDGTNWTVYNKGNSGLPDNSVLALAIDARNYKWIGTYAGGIAKFDGTNWTVYNTTNSGLPSDHVRAIAIDAQNNKWIGTKGGLAKFDGTNWTVYNTTNSELPSNNVNVLATDSQGSKWIGTWDGLAVFDGANWTVYNTGNSGLPTDYVNTISIDAQGNKWIGTWGSGLAVYREGGVILTGVENGRSAKVPTAFSLSQNYPNPFNPITTIRFALPKRSSVFLKVCDTIGREVATLLDGELQLGEYTVMFEARGLPSGLYFYRMTTDMGTITKKMLLLR